MDTMNISMYSVYLGVYFLSMIGIGVYHALKITTVEEYLVAGRKVGVLEDCGHDYRHSLWCGGIHRLCRHGVQQWNLRHLFLADSCCVFRSPVRVGVWPYLETIGSVRHS